MFVVMSTAKKLVTTRSTSNPGKSACKVNGSSTCDRASNGRSGWVVSKIGGSPYCTGAQFVNGTVLPCAG